MLPGFIDWLLAVFRKLDEGRLPNEPVGIQSEEDDGPVFAPPQPKGLKTIGAWCGSASLRNPGRDVDFCVAHGINRLDIIVNDHSVWREPTDFTVRGVTSIVRLADLARAAGIEVHLMSWLMPHSMYIEQAGNELIPLATLCQAKSIQWDAEEPWTKAKKAMPYEEASKLVAEVFKDRKFKMGVNGIGYASTQKLGPLAKVCDYVVPQAYATQSSGLKPDTAPGQFYRRWSSKFKKPVVMGLAAYRQKGIPGYSEREAILTAIKATHALGDVDTIIYWSLRHIRTNREVANAIATLAKQLPLSAAPVA